MWTDIPPIAFFRKRAYAKQLLAATEQIASTKNTDPEVYVREAGLLFDASDTEQKEACMKFSDHLEAKRIRTTCLSYVKETEHADMMIIPVYTKKDVRWTRVPIGEKVSEFINTKFDILFTTSHATSAHQKYITAASQALIKVGPSRSHTEHLDIVIDISDEEPLATFFERAESIINSLCPVES